MIKMYIGFDKNFNPVAVSQTPFPESTIDVMSIQHVTTLDLLVSLMQNCNVPITVSPENQDKLQ